VSKILIAVLSLISITPLFTVGVRI
jgi:hypothetical protein